MSRLAPFSQVEFPYVFPVDENLGEVVGVIDGEQASVGESGKGRAVEDAAESLVVFLHGLDLLVLFGLGKVGEKRGHFREVEFLDGDRLYRFRHGGEFLPFVVFLQGLSQFPVFGSGLAALADWGVVVVGGDVGSESRGVGSGPVSPVGSSVGHVEAEGDIFREHLVDTLDHVFCRTGLMVCSPFVEPSAPEFRAHQRAFRTQLLKFGELLVDVCARSEVHGPDQVVESVFGEVGCPVALEEGHVVAEVLAEHIADVGHVRLVLAI